MAQFYRIDGDSTQFRGVVPDIRFPFASDPADQGERSLDNALPWDHIAPADYHTQGSVSVGNLAELDRKRIAKDPGFQFLFQEFALAKQITEQKTVSLNEAKRKQEWEQREKAQRVNENAFRKEAGLKLLPAIPDTAEDDDEDSDEAAEKAISAIQAREAARILADSINEHRPLAAMAH
jgi:carboxyl-terminal processing protease